MRSCHAGCAAGWRTVATTRCTHWTCRWVVARERTPDEALIQQADLEVRVLVTKDDLISQMLQPHVRPAVGPLG